MSQVATSIETIVSNILQLGAPSVAHMPDIQLQVILTYYVLAFVLCYLVGLQYSLKRIVYCVYLYKIAIQSQQSKLMEIKFKILYTWRKGL